MRFDLPSGWRPVLLGEVVSLSSGKALPADLRDDSGSYPLMGANGEYGRCSQPLTADSVLTVGRVGASYGAVHRTFGPAWIADNALIARPRDDNDFRFVYYMLQTCDFRAVVSGSSQPLLTQHAITSIPVDLPQPREQMLIAAVLAALDDKIASNRRLAGLLEETAAAIFKARFVDFLGMEEFEKHSAERLPKGWRVGSLNDLGRFVNGKAFTKQANDRGRPILRIRELNGGIDARTPRSDIEASEDHVASADDILFAWSGSLGLYRWPGPESLINQHIFKVVPEGWPTWFVYGWIREHMPEFRAIAQDKATTMGHIQRRHLAEAVVPIPDHETIAAADDVLKWLDEHSRTLVAEAGTLRALRDRLLPKLISGEMRVPATADPEEVIGPATDQLVGATR